MSAIENKQVQVEATLRLAPVVAVVVIDAVARRILAELLVEAAADELHEHVFE